MRAKSQHQLRFTEPEEGWQPLQTHKQWERCGLFLPAALRGTQERLLRPSTPKGEGQVNRTQPLRWCWTGHRHVAPLPVAPGTCLPLLGLGSLSTNSLGGQDQGPSTDLPGNRMKATAPTSPQARMVHTPFNSQFQSHPWRQ